MLNCSNCGEEIEESPCNPCRKYKIRAYVCSKCGVKTANPSYVRTQANKPQ